MEYSRAFLGMGPTEWHLITKSPLNFCCLLRRIFTASLEWILSDADQWKHCKAWLASDVPKCWIPRSINPWSRPDSLWRPHSAGMNSFFQLPYHLFSIVEKNLRWSWLNVGIKPGRSPGSVSSDSHLKLATSPNPSVDFVFVYVK